MLKFDTKLTFSGSDYQPEQVVSCLHTHGCAVIRSGHDTVEAARFRDRLAELYADLDARYAAGTLTEDELKRCHRYGILRPLERPDYRMADGRTLADCMIQAVLATRLIEIVRGFIGTQVSIPVPTTHTRRQRMEQAERSVPFHQDSAVMGLHEVTILNFWFPLDPCGSEAPSVEFVPWNLQGILPHGDDSQTAGQLYANLEISEAAVGAVFNLSNTWAPVLAPGDVLMLTSKVIHRTFTRPGMTKLRRNFEVRFTSTPSFPERFSSQALHFDIARTPVLLPGGFVPTAAAAAATPAY